MEQVQAEKKIEREERIKEKNALAITKHTLISN